METDVHLKSKGSRRLFTNSVLEKMTHTHIAVPLTIFFFYAAGLLYWSITYTGIGVFYCVLLFLSGALVFTWVEYNMHRYLFHLETDAPWKETFQYTIHGVHHEFPKDKSRLAMPPVVSVTLATTLLWLLHFFIGGYVFAFFPGFLIGYASYLFIHYMVHVYPPPKNFFRALWINHAIHHYLKDTYIFGVSSPLWDYIYGTMPPKEKVKAIKDGGKI